MKEIGLTPNYKENFVNKCYSLKITGTQISKKELKINNHNSINKIFKLSESETFNKKNTIIKRENNKHLKKANNKLINIISNCMEKIKDEKNNDSPITPHLAGIIEKKIYLNEQKKKNKKQVTFKDNIQRKKTKNSLNKKSNNNLMHLYSNRFNSKNIFNEYNGNQQFKKIKTFSKEKEKEIVYNITSSLISLYKPKKKYSSSNDKYKYKNPKQRRYSCSLFKLNLNKRNNSKRSSKDEKLRSSLSNDSKILKKSSKPKKYLTFVKSDTSKNKKLKIKNSSKNNRNISEFTYQCKTESSSERNTLEKMSTEKGNRQKRNKKDNFNVLDWTKKFKNRENLTEGEYVHIEEDLRQSIIEYNKKELKNEMNNIENTEITNLVKRLPTMKNVKNNNFSGKKNLYLNLNLSNINIKNNIKYDKEKFRLLQHTGYVYDSLDDEEIEDAIDINYYYIKPDSIFIYIFDSIIALTSFFCLFYMPYYLAHDSFINMSYYNFKLILFYFIDFIYIIDLIISFFRSYYNYDEILIKTIPDMCCNYINNWFFVDLFSAIPFYSIFYILERKNQYYKSNSEKYYLYTYFGVKINKMHNLLLINKLLKIFKCFSDSNRSLSKLIKLLFKFDIIEEKIGIFFAIFILLAASNFGTCLFIFIGRNSYPSWINTIKIENESFTNIYICSLYYLIATITTVGYGDIYGRNIKEILFQIILLIIGTFTYSYLISLVSNFIKKLNEKSLIFENKLKILNEIKITNPHLQNNLYEKILRFLRYKKNAEKNKQNIIINNLPYSLRNALIIEMYKPIINNFIIFKGLENSNCIVQLVTAFKPIYAIRNDILLQEGDFIEEVIFIKTGIISLEISIDLNKPKESILQYLNKKYERDKSFTHSNNDIFNNSTYSAISNSPSFLNNRTAIKTEKKENKNTHYLKVLDIRKNEHFGETLMFLNERSPLTAKVKSKKAELFFLKKEEIIKIFNSFPNIWNRINKKSIYNMKQIKLTVRKVLLNFCSMIGVNIYKDYHLKNNKKRFSTLKKTNKHSKKEKEKKDIKHTIKEENNMGINSENIKPQNKEFIELNSPLNNNNDLNLSIIRSVNSLNKDKNSDTQINNNLIEKNDNNEEVSNNKKKHKSLSQNGDLIKTNNNELLSNFSKDNSNKLLYSNQKSTQFSANNTNNNNNNNNSKEINDLLQYKKKINNNFSCFKEMKNISYRSLPFNNANKYNHPKPENNDNCSKETIKISINKKVSPLINSESIDESKKSIIKNEEMNINDEIYENENFNLNCPYKDDLLKNKNIIKYYLNNNITIKQLSRKILEKTWIKNLENEKLNYLDKLLNKPKDNNSQRSSSNIDSQKESKFQTSSNFTWILNITNVEFFQIKSAYENINDITNNQYIKNNILRKKTKEFLLKECINDNYKKKSESKISSDSKFSKNLIFEKKNNMKINGKDKIIKSNTNESEIIQSQNLKKIRSSMKNFRYGNSNLGKNKNSDKKIYGLNISHSNKYLYKNDFVKINYSNNLLPHLFKRKNKKLSVKNNKQERANKSFRLNEEKEMSFYDKYSINKKFNYDTVEEHQSIKKRKKQDSELEEIKNNIKKETQNLIQPSLYYHQLFFNQIQKTKDNNQTFLPIKINKNLNYMNANINVRRTSTSRPTNNLRMSFGVSPKKNNQKSCVNIATKFKKL